MRTRTTRGAHPNSHGTKQCYTPQSWQVWPETQGILQENKDSVNCNGPANAGPLERRRADRVACRVRICAGGERTLFRDEHRTSGAVVPLLVLNVLLWTIAEGAIGVRFGTRTPEALLAIMALLAFQRGGFSMVPSQGLGPGSSAAWWLHVSLVLVAAMSFDRLAARVWVGGDRSFSPRFLASSFFLQNSASLSLLYRVRPPLGGDEPLLWGTALFILGGLLLSSRIQWVRRTHAMVDARLLVRVRRAFHGRRHSRVPTTSAIVGSWGPVSPHPPRTGNVLVVVMDTMRQDGLGIYGNPLPTSPNIDQWASAGTVFDSAYASSPYTHSSHASLFTGKLPTQHGALPAQRAGIGESKDKTDFGLRDIPLADSEETLAEELRDRGYRTGAFAGNSAYLAPWTGLDQGFETFDAPLARRLFFVPWSMSPALRMPPRVASNR